MRRPSSRSSSDFMIGRSLTSQRGSVSCLFKPFCKSDASGIAIDDSRLIERKIVLLHVMMSLLQKFKVGSDVESIWRNAHLATSISCPRTSGPYSLTSRSFYPPSWTVLYLIHRYGPSSSTSSANPSRWTTERTGPTPYSSNLSRSSSISSRSSPNTHHRRSHEHSPPSPDLLLPSLYSNRSIRLFA